MLNSPVTGFSAFSFILIYFSSIVKQEIFADVNQARICSWNKLVLDNEGKVSCSRKQQESFEWARSHDGQAYTAYELDALPTVTRGS